MNEPHLTTRDKNSELLTLNSDFLVSLSALSARWRARIASENNGEHTGYLFALGQCADELDALVVSQRAEQEENDSTRVDKGINRHGQDLPRRLTEVIR